MKKLSNQGLAKLLLMVQQVKAQSVKYLAEDKMQIRVDDLERKEFTQVSDYVDEVLFSEQPSKR